MGTKMLVTCDTGFEDVLVDELSELLPFHLIEKHSGRIFLEVSSEEDVAKLFMSRIANNIYSLIAVERNVEDLNTLYRAVKGIDFTKVIEPWQTFAIRSERIGKHPFTSIDIARVAGQAVIDSYIEVRGVRPKVNLDSPDVEVYVELNNDRLIVALSLTRGSLHARKYKLFAHPAGLKPSIASALLRIAGWRRGEPLLDPMCGGGTIVIEAATASKNIEVPCISASDIDFALLEKLYPRAMQHLNSVCMEKPKDVDRVFVGIDINPRFVEGATINAKYAGVDDVTLFLVGDLREVVPKLKAVEKELGAAFTTAVFNPPYGHRMKPGDLRKLYIDTLETLIGSGFKSIVFISSATRVCEEALSMFRDVVEVRRLRVIHGTLPSYVYRLRS